jgi:hypothetical protein
MRTIAVFALSLISVDAYAEDFRIGGEIGLFHDDVPVGSITALTEVIDADISIIDSLALVGGLPFVQIFGGGEERFRIGNPYAAAYYQMKGEYLRLRIGGGFAIPAAQLPEDEELFTALLMYGLGLSMNGVQGPWLWAPETVPIMVPSLRIGADIGILAIDGTADLVLMIPLHPDDGQDVEIFVPLSAGALVRLWVIGIGMRIGGVFLPTDDDDKFQFSLAPVITAELGPIELEARLTMNIDEPFGFSFEDGGVWGFFLGVHAVF